MSLLTVPWSVEGIQQSENDLSRDRYPINRALTLTQGSLTEDVDFRDACRNIIGQARPTDKEALAFAHEMNRGGYCAWVRGPEGERVFLHHCAILDLDLDPRKDVYGVIGGGVPHSDAWKWLTTSIAGQGGRALALSGIRSKAVGEVPSVYRGYPMSGDFAEWYYSHDEERAFYMDGYLHARLLHDLLLQGQIQGKIHLVGLSTGAGVMMAMSEAITTMPEDFPGLADHLASVHLVGPCACLPVGTDVEEEAKKLRRGFIRDGVATMLGDWRQVVVNMLDNGEPSWEGGDLLKQADRCVAASLPEVAKVLRPGVEVCIHAGLRDRAIPFELVAQTVRDLNPSEVSCLVRMLEIEGSHGVAVTSSTSLAHLLLNWPRNSA